MLSTDVKIRCFFKKYKTLLMLSTDVKRHFRMSYFSLKKWSRIKKWLNYENCPRKNSPEFKLVDASSDEGSVIWKLRGSAFKRRHLRCSRRPPSWDTGGSWECITSCLLTSPFWDEDLKNKIKINDVKSLMLK